ncbi:MAG: tRNA uridine-5-carboxymethylaminomethyl(34) synthesis GTPase MnmE [Acidobacteriota bacterium]|nr:tRNA uridine-5-carboxymethylaminomethyl(34) synthesis GTPase MnmE [Blastocatellia bacterium]MDW8412500.1 tRNA uridine-5-carboxymethylaminomethyl(34) synthesis GTPase MnmE [Acidobacteriota bacterium]
MYAEIEDTIAAVSTPPGRGAIGVLRLSGRLSHKIATTLAPNCKLQKVRYAQTCDIIDPETNEKIDRCVLILYRAPASFTGQDCAEFNCHGSPFVLARILRLCYAQGARPALPGEFTLRAFLNHKIDLVQAEAIRDLINAQSEYQAKLAARQLQGELSRYLQPIKATILEAVIHLESRVEFVDEALDTHSIEQLEQQLAKVATQLRRLVDSYRFGRLVREGIKLAIVGRPNVGKSSLFNALLQRDRAIVTDIPGTTRDTLTEVTSINGLPVHLVDTAGIRQTEDVVEKLGIERSYAAIADADLTLIVLDSSKPLCDEDFRILESCRCSKHFVVFNKCDLGVNENLLKDYKGFKVSAKTGEGIDELRQAIFNYFSAAEERPDLLLVDARHHNLIETALSELNLAKSRLKEGFSEEIALFHLHNTLSALAELTGETTVEDLLGLIFSTFCIGK